MKIFGDLVFIERGRDMPMQLVSIGLARADGTDLYRINPESLSNVARHPWLSMHAAPHLPMHSPSQGILAWQEDHEEYQYVAMSLDDLIADVLKFFADTPDPELWLHRGAYAHVVLHQLFGAMNEQPAAVPLFSRDLEELIIHNPAADLPPQPFRDHAMEDARWIRDAYWTLVVDDRRELLTKQSELTARLQTTEDAEVIEEHPGGEQ